MWTYFGHFSIYFVDQFSKFGSSCCIKNLSIMISKIDSTDFYQILLGLYTLRSPTKVIGCYLSKNPDLRDFGKRGKSKYF